MNVEGVVLQFTIDKVSSLSPIIHIHMVTRTQDLGLHPVHIHMVIRIHEPSIPPVHEL